MYVYKFSILKEVSFQVQWVQSSCKCSYKQKTCRHVMTLWLGLVSRLSCIKIWMHLSIATCFFAIFCVCLMLVFCMILLDIQLRRSFFLKLLVSDQLAPFPGSLLDEDIPSQY
jgi:hypothetical protein